MDSFEIDSDSLSVHAPASHDAPILSHICRSAPARGGYVSVADQIAAILPEQLAVAEVENLPKVRIDNSDYVLENWLHKRQKRSGAIFKHFLVLEKLESDLKGKKGPCMLCIHCDRKSKAKIFAGISPTSPTYHMKRDHPVHMETSTESAESLGEDSESPSPALSVLDQQRRAAQKRPLVVKDRAETFRELLLGWITDANIPLSAVENPLFRNFLLFLNPDLVKELLPSSANTIKSWIFDEYEKHMEILKEELASAVSAIHLSFDLWTSPNGLAILGTVCYFIDKAGHPQHRLLGLDRVSGDHSGENQARYLVRLIKDFGIEVRLGYFTADNAGSCDTAVWHVLKTLNPRATSAELDRLTEHFRIRCFGHILNLSAKAFLEGESSDIFDHHISPSEADNELELLNEWRKRGAIGKLHNLVHWIRRSPQRRDSFLSISLSTADQEILDELGVWFVNDELKGVMVRADHDTRWNSIYLMIERALKLRPVIQVFCRFASSEPDHHKRLPENLVLEQEDWQILTEIAEVLQPYLKYTKHFEGNKSRFAEALVTIYELQKHLTLMRDRYTNNLIPEPFRPPRLTLDEPIQDCIEVAATTQSRAAESVDDTEPAQRSRPRRQINLPARFRDMLLEDRPRLRTTVTAPAPLIGDGAADAADAAEPSSVRLTDDGLHFIQHCLKLALEKLEKYRVLMEESNVYWAAHILHPGYGLSWIKENLPRQQQQQILDDFKAFFDEHFPAVARAQSPGGEPEDSEPSDLLFTTPQPLPPTPRVIDEVEEYLREAPVYRFKGEQLFTWWFDRRERFPRLFRMAMTVLSIAAMSSENERIFSAAKLTISPQRNSLHWFTVQALQCLRQWAKSGAVKWGAKFKEVVVGKRHKLI